MTVRSDEKRIRETILDRLGEVTLRLARSSIESQTLKDALRFEKRRLVGKSRLFIPHYWAVYHHDGRGPIFKRGRGFLVYYRDVNDDPRYRRQGHPITRTQARNNRLSAAEFQAGMAENYRRWKANPNGGKMQFMVIRKSVGPTAKDKSYPFFTKGMERFPQIAARIIDRVIEQEFRSFAGKVEKDSVTLRL